MKKIITIFSVILMGLSVSANLTIRVGAGYGLANQKYLLEEVFTSSASENIYGSFGGNLGIYGGASIDLNEHIELGADLGFQAGRKVEAFGTFMQKTYIGRLIFLKPTLTYKTALDENFTPYAKVGLLTGFPIMNLDVNGDLKKFRGGIPLGATGAIGLVYNLSENIKLFGEIENQSMLYKPTKRKESNGGVVVFTDVLDNAAPASSEIHHHFFSYGAIGLNLGVKIIL